MTPAATYTHSYIGSRHKHTCCHRCCCYSCYCYSHCRRCRNCRHCFLCECRELLGCWEASTSVHLATAAVKRRHGGTKRQSFEGRGARAHCRVPGTSTPCGCGPQRRGCGGTLVVHRHQQQLPLPKPCQQAADARRGTQYHAPHAAVVPPGRYPPCQAHAAGCRWWRTVLPRCTPRASACRCTCVRAGSRTRRAQERRLHARHMRKQRQQRTQRATSPTHPQPPPCRRHAASQPARHVVAARLDHPDPMPMSQCTGSSAPLP